MITFKDYNPANPWQVTGESQTISLTGKVVLNYIPLKGSITIPGYTETTSQSPGLTEFYVDYQDSTSYRTAKGILQFNVAAAGAVVSVTYKGVSTMIWASVMNEIKAFMESYGLSGVAAGTYQFGNYAVNSQGRITEIEPVTPGMKNKLINGDFAIWQRGANAIPTTLRARTSNVATITTDRPHGYAVGDTVQITGLADTVANVTATLTAVTSTTFSFSNTGSDVASVADTGGRCLITNRPSFAVADTSFLYLADRWVMTKDGVMSSLILSQQSFTPGQVEVQGEPTNYIKVQHAADSTTLLFLSQRIEGVRCLSGKKVTLSFYAKYKDVAQNMIVQLVQNFGSGGSAPVASSFNVVSIGTTFAKYSMTMTIPSVFGKTIGDGSYVGLTFRLAAGVAFEFSLAQVQFEEGSVATPFEQRHPATELALCQRYYETNYSFGYPVGKAGGNTAYYFTSRTADQLDRVQVQYKVSKRLSPTVTLFSSLTGLSGKASDGTSDISVSASSLGNAGFVLYPTQPTSANTMYTYMWTADAEL